MWKKKILLFIGLVFDLARSEFKFEIRKHLILLLLEIF